MNDNQHNNAQRRQTPFGYNAVDIQPGVTVSETNVVIILPAMGTDPVGFTQLADNIVNMLRNSVSGLLHDRILEALLKAEVAGVAPRGEMTVNEYIATLEG